MMTKKRVLFYGPGIVALVVSFLALVFSTSGGMAQSNAIDMSDCTPIYTLKDGSMLVLCPPHSEEVETETPTEVVVTETATDAATETPTDMPMETPTDTPTDVPMVTETATQFVAIAPYPTAPLCPDSGESHEYDQFHTLWDEVRGCHYDHEHGESPFTSEFAAAFTDLGDPYALLGNVEIGHTNLSSPMENTHKHGGFKWQVDLAAPKGCAVGFEGGTVAVKKYGIQFHSFGRQDIEHEVRNHSTAVFLEFCKQGDPEDVGYMYAVQLQEYGQRVMPYQGMPMPYPDAFVPQWDSLRGQYFTTECFGSSFVFNTPFGPRTVACRPTSGDPNNNLSIWTSKVTGAGARPPGSSLFRLLFRSRDNYQRADSSDLTWPFTWMFVCGGANYSPAGCRHNSSTFTVHEVMGDIPAAWDNQPFDTDTRVGRITATLFVDKFGTLLTSTECTASGGNCHPLVLVNAFVGRYSSELTSAKVSNPTPLNTPERDIYFCNGSVCLETSAGAVPSGWIESEN